MKITKTIAVKPLKDQTKAGVLSVVRRMLARNMENKVVGWAVEQSVSHNSAISAADCEPLVGEITPIDSASANTSQQRMGDRVRPKSLKVRGIVSLSTASPPSGQQSFYVRVIIASQKTIKVGSAVLASSVDTNRLLHPGFAGVGVDQAPFNGNTEELNYPVNTNLFKVYMDKIIKLDPPAPGSVEAVTQFTKRWSYTFKSLPSTLTFDEGNGDWANNFAPFVAIGYAYSDNTSPDTLSTRIKSNVFSQLQFEDA